MLSLLMMLIQDPATTTGPVPPPEVRVRTRLIVDGVTVARCDPGGIQQIDQPSGEVPDLRPDLTFRPDGEVRRYLLLDRTVRGCPAPISYPLPGRQDGFIRDLTNPAERVQPPRSSE